MIYQIRCLITNNVWVKLPSPSIEVLKFVLVWQQGFFVFCFLGLFVSITSGVVADKNQILCQNVDFRFKKEGRQQCSMGKYDLRNQSNPARCGITIPQGPLPSVQQLNNSSWLSIKLRDRIIFINPQFYLVVAKLFIAHSIYKYIGKVKNEAKNKTENQKEKCNYSLVDFVRLGFYRRSFEVILQFNFEHCPFYYE